MKRKSNLWIAFCLAAALSLLVGCGSGGKLKEVKLPDSMTVTVGDVVPVPYELIYDGAQAENQEEPSFSWSSSDPSIAAVDAEGNLTAIAEGNCTVQLTGPDEISASVKVTVNAAAPKNPLVVQSAEMIADEETVIQIEGVDDPAAQGYQFSSDNPEIAEVDASGKVIAHKSGVATITVSAPNGESYTFSVSVYLSEQERDEAVASASKKNPDSSSAASGVNSNKNNGTSGNNTGSAGSSTGTTSGSSGSTGNITSEKCGTCGLPLQGDVTGNCLFGGNHPAPAPEGGGIGQGNVTIPGGGTFDGNGGDAEYGGRPQEPPIAPPPVDINKDNS